MLIEIPEYYQDFACIGARCSDNCCIGWEIDIDPDTLEDYRKTGGSFGARMQAAISSGDTPHFILKGERCPFLNTQNLCDIILTLGEEHLCEICRLHPRFFTRYGNRCAMGIGLCCEAAAALILGQEGAVRFLIENQEEDGEESVFCTWLFQMKERMLSILQNREYPICDRLVSALDFAEKIQDRLEHEDYESEIAQNWLPVGETPAVQGASAMRALLSVYQILEPLDPQWIEKLGMLEQKIDVLAEKSTSFTRENPELSNDYEQLAVYFIHRYWLRAGEDRDVLGKVHLMLASVLLIRLLDLDAWCAEGKLTRAKQVELVKAYSKEVEYSEENLETLAEASIEHPAFLKENLIAAILW